MLISFLLNYFLVSERQIGTEIYNACAFGFGWGLAYFVDRPEWKLQKKLGISLIGIVILVAIGLIFFNFETTIPSIIKFSTIFVAYYIIASFRESKSLRK